jgi:hypothetical protein
VDLHEEGDETGVEDQQDEQVSTVSLQKEVKDLSAKLNQVLGTVANLTKQTSSSSILQEAAGVQSAPGRVSGDNNLSESEVPVYSGDRLALCVGEADINLEHDPQFRHLSHQWNQTFGQALPEGSKSVRPTDHHKTNVLSCVARVIRRLKLFFRTSKRFRFVCSFSLT